MEEQTTSTAKKTTRTRKTAPQSEATSVETNLVTSSPVIPPSSIIQIFDDLMTKLIKTKGEFDNLQKEIAQIKQDWAREQKQHELELSQQRAHAEVERKREEETYQYSTSLTRKRAEDEFEDKKLAWEKDLSQRKEELAKEKQELEHLRKMSADFEGQKESAIKETEVLLDKKLTEEFETEKKLREQEIKAEKEILGLKIANFEAENSRLNKEIEILKRSLDEATRQVKEIAVKVIESGSQAKTQTTSES